ncbi:hypothetical protein R1sor_004211 [Riccia sorocarpa]|uniref:Uncharacterized protein n=1 Tax=Riccia sorocarpa TaxID=122646 RepID=A0ABD3H6P1_9MARC
MAEAKSAKSGRSAKGKGKVVVQETQKKKPSVPSQAPREKLLGSSFAAAAAAETGRNSRESKTDSLKRKRESLVTPPPPPKLHVTETSESSEEEENIASDKEKSEESDSGSDSPLPSQPVNKKVSKLKTLKQMDKSHIDREKLDVRRRAVERCRVSAVPIVIPLEQLVEPTLEQDSSKWGPYQIRALSESFVDTLTTSMMTNTDNNYHSLVVVLQPRFCTKHTKEDWQDNYALTWRFDCLGGNHSLATPHDDNADALIRRKYTFAQQIEYYHKQFLERGDEPTNELRMRLTIETQVIGPGQSVESKMLSTEAYFQIAFREGPLWEVEHALFEKYNKKDNSKKKGKKADGEGQITLTSFKPLVSVSDDRKLSILLRLLKGEIKLEDVKTECEACKINDIMAMCFCKQVGVSSWEEAKEKLPEYATEKRINQYHTLFKDVMKKAPNRVFLRKYCNIDDDEAGPPEKPRGPQLTPLQVIPMDFINFCARAKKYRLALERGDADPLGDEDTRFRNFKPEGAEFSTKWQIYKEDVCHLQGHIPEFPHSPRHLRVPSTRHRVR